jgi:hypothetical protein
LFLLIDTYFIMKNSYPNLTIISPSNALLNAFKKQLFFVFALFALTNYSFGQGTTCSNATNISINGSCLSSNSNALTGNDSNPSFVNCQNNGNVNNVRWYTFTVTGGPLSVTITAIGNRNLAFQLIGSTTNNCSNLSEIQCVNNVNGTGINDSTETTTNLLTNGTYFIKILNNANNNNLDLTSLCVTGVAPENTVPSTGNNAYTLCSGNLYDNGGSAGNYANSSNGYTVINPSIVGNFSRVTGSITTEGGYDYMTIYDGVGTGGTILWGGFPHGSGTSCATYAVPTITSLTGSLTVQFYSDGSNNCSGFNLTISCSTTAGIPVYCTPTTSQSSIYISGIRAVGTLADASNLLTTYSTNGYGNYSGITIASQAPLGPVNIEINLTGGVQFIKTYVDWNNDYDFDDANELVYDTGSVATGDTTYGFIIPSGVAAGNYRMRVKTRAFISSGSTITPCNSYDYGETEDYTLNIVNDCAAKITSVTNGSNCGTGTVTLGAVGAGSPTGYKWYANSADTVPLATTGTGSWTTPSISTTTTYYVTAINASPCESLIKTPVKATIKPTTNITFTPVAPIVCGDNTIITISASGDTEEVELINEDFEGGLGVFTSTTPTNIGGGVDTPWSVKTSTYQPTTTTVFKPALSSGSIGNKFAFTTSDYTSSNIVTNLTSTTSINTNTFTSLTLTFRHYYSYFGGDSGKVEVSTDGGSTWLAANVIATYNSDIGSPSKFQNVSINMNTYVGQSNLKIRFKYEATWDDGWAIDDIRLFGTRPLTAAFTWSGATVDAYIDAAATIPYTTQSVSNLYIKPTAAQLELNSWTFTGTVTLSNGCSVSSPLTVTNNTKTWQGVTADWNTASNWKPSGIPTINNCVVIPNNTVISGSNYNAYGKNLIVKSGGSLNIQPLNNLTIADGIIVEPTGVFQIENNSNLVQINNTVNSGNIIYKRIAPSIKGSDYVYWSSPVNNQTLNSIYTSPAQGPKYEWNTLINNGNGTGGNISQGNWVSPTATMATGKGYIIRGSSSFGMAATDINSSFTGRPNNGNIGVTVNRGVYNDVDYFGANGALITSLDDNHNLIGNPYPSAINALRFIYDNSAVIKGTIKLWKHGIDPGLNNGGTITNPFYGTYTYNYSASDYMVITYTGSTVPTASSSIKAGQAFFVEMQNGTEGSGTVFFNNVQRRDSGGLPYANDNFFRNANQENDDLDNLERHRIWLDILDSNNTSERALVGYIEGATMGDDNNYDAIADPLTMGIYSLINNKPFIIQGRSLPFDDNDQVAIGFNVPSTGTYKIAINTADGLFLGSQNIYLKDELLNIYHDLKSAPYSFTATAGVYNNRFKLVYKNTVLSNVAFNENEIQIAKNKNIIDIVSGNEIMDNVKVYDIRGRLLVEKTKINANTISIDMNNIQDQVLIINIVTTEGVKVTKKIL